MEENKQSMYRVARGFLRDQEDIADAMAETVLNCFEKIGTLQQNGYFKTWMIRILINNCKDILQKQRRSIPTEEVPEPESGMNVNRDEDNLAYEFTLNYELVPGEYQVKADYIPEGFADDEDGGGKYYAEADDGWITIMPIYTTAEIERINSEITVKGIDQVEHMEPSGMEADVITFRDAEKNLSNVDIYLFNEEEGYQVDRKDGMP